MAICKKGGNIQWHSMKDIMCIAQNIDIIEQERLWGLPITEKQLGDSGYQEKENKKLIKIIREI